MSEAKCSSCKKNVSNVTGTVKFVCPGCGKEEITRCVECRKNVVKYTCPSCGFEGPN
ncbi:RNA-binding protein [Candidatus Woesearchaeota archaeon]|nr:MAG: RNA-binding protein [Candidatus Woesearchaeota archaeon]